MKCGIQTLKRQHGEKKVMKRKVQKDRDNETKQSQPNAKMRKYVALGFTVTTVGDEKRLCSYRYVLCIRWHTKFLSAKKPYTTAEELTLPAAVDMVSVMLNDANAAKNGMRKDLRAFIKKVSPNAEWALLYTEKHLHQGNIPLN